MYNDVSVDRALSRGQRLINLPVLAIFFLCLGLGIYLVIQKSYPGLITVGISLQVAFILSWLYWSFMITKWRIWAFENVRNVHELKKRAIRDKLIWPDESIFAKTEIRTKNDRERIKALELKFAEEDLFIDDCLVPCETVVYYDKAKNYFEMLGGLACLVGGLFLAVIKDEYLFGLFLMILGFYGTYCEYKEATNKTPQIIINGRGLKTKSMDFYSWDQIVNDEAICEGSGRSARDYLVYDHPEGSERLLIDDYNITRKELNKLLILYRGRNKNNKKNL